MKARKGKDERREAMIGGLAESSDKLTSPVVGAFGRRSRASSARVRAPDSTVLYCSENPLLPLSCLHTFSHSSPQFVVVTCRPGGRRLRGGRVVGCFATYLR